MVIPSVLYEAIIVGIYTEIIFRIITMFLQNASIPTLFVVGFLKHFLGYYLQLQSSFCYYYGKSHAIITDNFINECIIEGIIFTLIYLLLPSAFMSGFLLHIISEYTGIHNLFIKYRCRK